MVHIITHQIVHQICRYLNATFSSPSPVGPGDVKTVVKSVANNIIGRDVVFDFLREHWDLFNER